MVEELPPNRQQNHTDAVESPAINFAPETTTRTDTPLWPTSRTEEESRRDILNRYPSQDTASGYLPQFRSSASGNDGRFDNLSRGANLFTAESIALAGGPGTARGTRPNEQVVRDLQGYLHTIVGANGDGQIYGRGPGGPFGDAGGGPYGDARAARGRESARGQSDDLDIFAQIKAKSTVDARTEYRDSKSDPKKPEAKDDKADWPKEVKHDYPDGKGGIEAKRDKDGNLTEFTLKDKSGEMNFHKDELGRWIKTDRFGVESIVNGKFDLSKAGELSYKKPNGEVHIHKLDGTVAKARELQDGSVVQLDDSGKHAAVLNRKDGSKVEATYDKNDLTKVVETDKTGSQRTTWTKDKDGVWHSKSETKDNEGKWNDDRKPSQERRNLELNVNGRYTYEDKLAFKHVVNGDGTERIEPKVTVNKDGTKTVEIQYPDNKGFRTITLDKDNKVTRFTEQDADGKRTYFKDRQGDWYLKAGLRNVKVGGDFALLKNGDFVSKDGDRYDIQGLDGNIIREKVNSNGTRLRYNDDNAVSKLTRKDGSVVDVNYVSGEKKQIVDTNKDETQRTVWTKNDKGTWVSQAEKKDKDGKWVADASKKPEERKDVEINSQGLTIATDLRGFKHVIGADGQKLNEGPGGSKFTFDEKGRIESITYGPGANRQFKFHYDNNDNIDRVEVRDGKGNLQQTRTKTGEGTWKITKADGSDGGTWKGQIKLSPEGNLMQQSEKERASGQWQVITPAYEKYNEKVDGKNITRTYPDKTQVQSEKLANGEERVTRITHGKESREFRYDSQGKLSEVVDTTDKGTKTWKPEGDKVKIYPNGDVAYEKNDGSAVIKKGNFSTVELNKDGDITKVTTKDGKTRTFEYENIKGKSELVRISDSRPTKDGEKTETWTRKKNSDGSVSDQWVSPGAGGKEKVRTGIEVLQDGDYKYKGTDGKEKIARVGKVDDGSGLSENVDEARDRLKEAMESHLDEPRRQRLQQMMERFEKRAQERIEAQTAGGRNAEEARADWDKKVAQTYDALTHMVTSNEPGATYDQATRAKLVENAVFSMAWPAKANDQGNWGCCWQISGVYAGVIAHPEKMAKMLDELATKGTFTDVNGKTWTPPKNLLSFTDQGGNWTIDNCGNGRRSPCSEIWTSVAAYLSQDGRRLDRGANGGSPEGMNHAMKMITGDTFIGNGSEGAMSSARYKQELLMKGAVVLMSPGHMYLGFLEKNNGQWIVGRSLQHGDGGRATLGTITDLKAWDVRGTLGGYRPDTPAFPKCNDGGVGPSRPNGPNRPNRWNSWNNDYYPQYQPEFRPRWNDPQTYGPDGSAARAEREARNRTDAQDKARQEGEEKARARRRKDAADEEQAAQETRKSYPRRRRF